MWTALLSIAFAAPPADASGIRWIADDWAAAKQAAIAAKKPVAVDVWATWCHTCLSMKHYVLTDAALAKVKDKVIWLALDYDRPDNAAFFEKFPITAFPTFLLIDPVDEQVKGRWLGSGTPESMAAFFGAGSGAASLEVERALARQDFEGAAKLAEARLADPKLTPKERTRVRLGWIEALWKQDPKSCARRGVMAVDDVDRSAQGLDFVALVAGCAEELPVEERALVMKKLASLLGPAVDDPKLAVSIDDRSNLYATYADVLVALGERDAARAVQEKRLALLESAAKQARSAHERATFDDHRSQVYLQLGRGAEAEVMLKESEAAQPQDFNHPWRLAKVYLAAERLPEGLAAIERALARGYGARKLRLYTTKIDLLVAAKRDADARRTVQEARAHLAQLPKASIRPAWVAELEGRAKKLESPRQN